MTSSSNLDPFEMWRQVVTKLEGGHQFDGEQQHEL